MGAGSLLVACRLTHSFQPTRPLRCGSFRSVKLVGRAAELRIRYTSLPPCCSSIPARAIVVTATGNGVAAISCIADAYNVNPEQGR